MAIPVGPVADGAWSAQASAARAQAAVAAEAQAGASEVAEPTAVELERAVSEVNASFDTLLVGLQFEIDEDTDKVVVKVVDRASGEVIRQIPSEEAVRIARMLGDKPGALMSQRA